MGKGLGVVAEPPACSMKRAWPTFWYFDLTLFLTKFMPQNYTVELQDKTTTRQNPSCFKY